MAGSTRRTVALLVATLAVAVAGCGAPTAGSSPATGTDTPDQSANITVVNGTLASDPGVTYARLQSMRGTDEQAPTSIQIHNFTEEMRNVSTAGPAGIQPPIFWEYLNVSSAHVPAIRQAGMLFNGVVQGDGTIHLFLHERATNDTQALVVPHELTHYLQFQSGQNQALQTAVDTTTTDGAYVRRSLVEGDAVYMTDAYIERYNTTTRHNAPIYQTLKNAHPRGHAGRYLNDRYIVGHEYVASQVDEPADIPDLYESPPTTSEQLLHNYSPGTEPPAPLAVTRSTGGDWRHVGTDRMGEAFIRHALASDLSPTRAETAATGWGNDSLEIFRHDDAEDPSYAWVLRWDDADEATEFETAMTDFFDGVGTAADGRWELADPDGAVSLDRPSDDVVVVRVGSEAFLADSSVEADGEAVSVTVG